MAAQTSDSSVAILIDCDNVRPEIVDFALRMAVQEGRVTIRRGYGNKGTLSSTWEQALVRQAFTPCLQFQYASKKNTSDIALALDAQEALFDELVDIFCLVTSDSDFAYLCRKLRERGATVYIVGEPKTPDALRNACDRFFEWTPELEAIQASDAETPEAPSPPPTKATPAPPTKTIKKRPRFVVEAVALLAAGTPDGRVSVSALSQYLKRTDSAFSPAVYGHSGLVDMIKTYDLLEPHMETGGHWTVSLAAKSE